MNFLLLVVPLRPQNVAAVDATSSSITWTWDKPLNHSNKITHYQGEVDNLGRVNVTTGTYYQWSGLLANTQYRFRVRAVTGSGNNGNWSLWTNYRTLPAGMPVVYATVASCIDKLMDFCHFKFLTALTSPHSSNQPKSVN